MGVGRRERTRRPRSLLLSPLFRTLLAHSVAQVVARDAHLEQGRRQGKCDEGEAGGGVDRRAEDKFAGRRQRVGEPARDGEAVGDDLGVADAAEALEEVGLARDLGKGLGRGGGGEGRRRPRASHLARPTTKPPPARRSPWKN